MVPLTLAPPTELPQNSYRCISATKRTASAAFKYLVAPPLF